MSEILNSTTKSIIDTQINRLKETLKSDYEPRNDLDFVDVFFPKLCAIYGTKICLELYEGKDITELLSQRGLSSKDFARIDEMMQKGKNYFEQNNNELEKLFEVENTFNSELKLYAERVREKLKKDNKEIDLEIIENAIKDSFYNNQNLYTPCSVYENSKENIVK